MMECILWEGAFFSSGYGALSYAAGMLKRAHICTYEAQYGNVPSGYVVHHECEVKACVNPHHLLLMTEEDHNKMHNPRWKICSKGHPMSDANTSVLASGRMRCKSCMNEYQRTSRTRQ